ncbi:hypothetical protein [Gimesia maris]|uniref:hypothetical protein n=1 Tax=Gimesia maris TaxID=122 RepID=UPI0030DD6C02|tara:strand:- start:140082 stop:140246 length:165 start_codon:yes stop_codon:yes gene_type:complete
MDQQHHRFFQLLYFFCLLAGWFCLSLIYESPLIWIQNIFMLLRADNVNQGPALV